MTSPIFNRLRAIAQTDAQADAHKNLLLATLVSHPAVKEAFRMVPADIRKHAWLSPAKYDNNVGFGVSLRDLSGFKDPRLLRALAPFTGSEWDAYTQDWPHARNRDYRFLRTVVFTPEQSAKMQRLPSARWLSKHNHAWMVPTSVKIGVTVYAYVKEDSETCRVVVTGIEEQVVRTEKKEFICA